MRRLGREFDDVVEEEEFGREGRQPLGQIGRDGHQAAQPQAAAGVFRQRREHVVRERGLGHPPKQQHSWKPGQLPDGLGGERGPVELEPHHLRGQEWPFSIRPLIDALEAREHRRGLRREVLHVRQPAVPPVAQPRQHLRLLRRERGKAEDRQARSPVVGN